MRCADTDNSDDEELGGVYHATTPQADGGRGLATLEGPGSKGQTPEHGNSKGIDLAEI